MQSFGLLLQCKDKYGQKEKRLGEQIETSQRSSKARVREATLKEYDKPRQVCDLYPIVYEANYVRIMYLLAT
jgi:hypothetical protein